MCLTCTIQYVKSVMSKLVYGFSYSKYMYHWLNEAISQGFIIHILNSTALLFIFDETTSGSSLCLKNSMPAELKIREGIEDNSKIIFLISQ